MISSVNQGNDHHDNELLRTDSTSNDTPVTPVTPQSPPTFEAITSRQSEFQVNAAETMTTQTFKTQRSSARTRRKGPLKLRFHHQALPQEYLNHYESQQQSQMLRQENLRQQQSQTKKKPMTKSQVSLAPPPVAPKPSDAKTSNESIISWLQNILELQNNEEPKVVTPKVRNIPIELPPTSSRTQCLKDLPYMGEMTLENMKPRRGRKPKKADICHLIYKNYGTIVPGSTAPTASTSSVTASSNVKKLDESKKKSPLVIKKDKQVSEKLKAAPRKGSQNEPLNLCVRETIIRTEDSSILISDDNDESVDLIARSTRNKNRNETSTLR